MHRAVERFSEMILVLRLDTPPAALRKVRQIVQGAHTAHRSALVDLPGCKVLLMLAMMLC